MRGRGDARGSGPGRGSSSTRGFGTNAVGYGSGTERGRGARGSWSGRGGYRGPPSGRGSFGASPGPGPNQFGPPPGGFPVRGREFRGGEYMGAGRGSGMPFRGGFSSPGRGQGYSATNKRTYSEEPRVYIWKLTDDISESDLMEHFGQFGEIKDVFIALSPGGSTRVGYALLYPAKPETVEAIVNSSPHVIRDTTLRVSYPRDSAPIAKRWRSHDTEDPSHDSHVTQPESDSFQDVGNVADDYVSEASLTIDYEDAAEHSQEDADDSMQIDSEPNTRPAEEGETVLNTASLPFDGKVIQPVNEQSKSESESKVEENEERKHQCPSGDEGHKKHGESAQRQGKEGEDDKQGKDESSRERKSSSERGRTARSDHRDRRERLERRQRSRSRERRRRSPSPRENRSRFGERRNGRHSPPGSSSERFGRSRRPLSTSGSRPRSTSRWDSDEKSDSRFRQSFPPSQANKHERPGQDFNSRGRGRPRDYPRPGPRSMEAHQGPMGTEPVGPMGPSPGGPSRTGAHDGPFNSPPPWGRKTLLPTPPVPPNEDTPIHPPGHGGPPRDNYPPHDGPPPNEGRWSRGEPVGQGFVDKHYSGPPPDHRGRPGERDSFGASPLFADRGPPPQSHHPQDTPWQRHGRDPLHGAQQPGFGGSGNQRQPHAPPGWQQDDRSFGGIQPSNFGGDGQQHNEPRGHYQQGFVSDSHSQPGASRPPEPHYDGMQHKFAAPQQSYQGLPPQGYTAPSGKGSAENYHGQQTNYGGQQQNFDGQQTRQGGQHQNFGQQPTFNSQAHSFEKHPQDYSGQWASHEQGPDYDGRSRQSFDQQQGFDGQQQRYEGQHKNFGAQQQRFDGQQQGFHGQHQRYEGQQQRFEGQQQRYDNQQQRYEGQQQRFEGQQQKYDGQQQKHDGQQVRYDGQQQRYDGQQQRYDGQQQRYDGQQQRYDGQQQRYDGQQQRYDGQQQRYDGQQQRYDGQQQRYDGQQQRYDGQQQRYDGQQQRYDGQQQRYDGQQQRYDGQQQRYDGQQQRYDGQQQRYDGQQQRYDGQQQRYDGQQQRYDQPEQRYDRPQKTFGQNQQSERNLQPNFSHQPNYGQPPSQQEYGHSHDAPPNTRPAHPHHGEYGHSGVGRGQLQPSGVVGPSPQGPPSTINNQQGWRRQQEGQPPNLFPQPRTNQADYGTKSSEFSHPPPQQGYPSAPSQEQSSRNAVSMHHSTHETLGGTHSNSTAAYGSGYQGDGMVKYGQGPAGPTGEAKGPGMPRFREEERQQGGSAQYGRPQQHKGEWQSHDQRNHTQQGQPSRDWPTTPSSRPQEHSQPTPEVGYMPKASSQQSVPKIDTKALEALLADSDNIYSAYIKRAKSQD